MATLTSMEPLNSRSTGRGTRKHSAK